MKTNDGLRACGALNQARRDEGIEQDQVADYGGQGEMKTNDGAEYSDDQESEDAGKSRFAGMWSPKPGDTRRPTRPSETYHVEDDSSNASEHYERAEPHDNSKVRRPEWSQHYAPQGDYEQPWTRRDPRAGH